MNLLRANLYQALAEVLAEPPDWLALAGNKWPLFEAALQLAPEFESARLAVVAMTEIGEEPLELRRSRYAALFAGPGRPRVWIYESGLLHGRLFTETTFEVEQWYRAAGLNIEGAELPDHASLELAFLAQLSGAELAEFSHYENDFLDRHAIRWLPALGRALDASGDMVYAPIGRLLADWLDVINPRIDRHQPRASCFPSRRMPVIPADQLENCILCGFCAQVCPVRALVVRENQLATSLQLSANLCVGCGKCVRVCEPHVLVMEGTQMRLEPVPEWQTVRQSPRPGCKTCGKPLVSQAELNFVVERLGSTAWLELCQDCRTSIY